MRANCKTLQRWLLLKPLRHQHRHWCYSWAWCSPPHRTECFSAPARSRQTPKLYLAQPPENESQTHLETKRRLSAPVASLQTATVPRGTFPQMLHGRCFWQSWNVSQCLHHCTFVKNTLTLLNVPGSASVDPKHGLVSISAL